MSREGRPQLRRRARRSWSDDERKAVHEREGEGGGSGVLRAKSSGRMRVWALDALSYGPVEKTNPLPSKEKSDLMYESKEIRRLVDAFFGPGVLFEYYRGKKVRISGLEVIAQVNLSNQRGRATTTLQNHHERKEIVPLGGIRGLLTSSKDRSFEPMWDAQPLWRIVEDIRMAQVPWLIGFLPKLLNLSSLKSHQGLAISLKSLSH